VPADVLDPVEQLIIKIFDQLESCRLVDAALFKAKFHWDQFLVTFS